MDTEKNDSNRQQRKKEKDGPDKNDTNTWQGQRDERKVMRLKENTNREERQVEGRYREERKEMMRLIECTDIGREKVHSGRETRT